MMKLLYVSVVLLIGTSIYAQDNLPETVNELNVEKYIGRWYQMYTNIIVNVTFEKDSYCVTADYSPINATYISVYNSGPVNSPTSDEVLDISGYAYQASPAEPGKLVLQLDDIPQGDYWIINLGPETFGEEGLYQYSIVTTPEILQLYVLARDVQGFRDNYETEVLVFLADNGFDRAINEPIETYHGPDCNYTDPPSS